MFRDLIMSLRKVNIYYGRETGCITTTITNYYEKFDMIKVDYHDMLIPVNAIAKIEILEEPLNQVSAQAARQARPELFTVK